MSATITIRATRARMRAYSTIPWPSWVQRKKRIMNTGRLTIRPCFLVGVIASAADVVLAHRRDDVRVEVDYLAAGGDQRHDHDQSHEREDERVFDHALGRLAPCGPSFHWPASLTVEPPAPIASMIACSTTTRTIRLRQKWVRSALSRGLAGFAASSAAALITPWSSRLPARNSPAAVASSGCDATALKTMRQESTTSPSSSTATAAPAIGKSIEPRRLSFT